MSLIKASLTFAILALTLSACEVRVNGDPADEPSGGVSHQVREAYQFKVGGCDTGEHAFVSDDASVTRAELCVSLKDESTNNWCAEDSRREYFDIICPGQSWN